MRKNIIFGIILTLISSCNMDKPQPEPPNWDEPIENSNNTEDNDDLPVYPVDMPPPPVLPDIVIVDNALNDRLNPESPAYFGEEYVEGIDLLILYKSEKISYKDYYVLPEIKGGLADISVEEFVRNYNPVLSPYRDMPDGRVSRLSRGYYFIPLAFNVQCICYIHYPDGSEDEIKFQMFKAERSEIVDKIWVNGELAYAVSEYEKSFREGNEPDMKDADSDYYNPKYYPDSFLELVQDNEYFPLGYMKPKDGINLLAVTK